MSQFFKILNIFSQTPSLRINGEIRPFSIFGSIIGFITMSILIAAISIILYENFSRFNFRINSYTDNSAKPDIDLKNFKLGFVLTDAMGKEIPDEDKILKTSAKFWDLHVPVWGDNTNSLSVKMEDIPIIKCNQYQSGTLFSKNFTEFSKNIKNLSCLDIQKLNKNLKGTYGNVGK